MTDFTTIKLANHRVLVKGTDSFGVIGQTVLNSTQWEGILETLNHNTAEDQFNKAVEEFYAPLIEKIDAIQAAEQRSIVDDAYVFSVGETVEAVDAVAPTTYRLTQDSAILRLLADGEFDRLIWVGDKLEITAAVEDESPAEAEATVDAATDAE